MKPPSTTARCVPTKFRRFTGRILPMRPAGSYSQPQSVSITSATPGSAIRYTTDGTTPSETVGTLYTGTPVVIKEGTMLKAIAYKAGMAVSVVTSEIYTINNGR